MEKNLWFPQNGTREHNVLLYGGDELKIFKLAEIEGHVLRLRKPNFSIIEG